MNPIKTAKALYVVSAIVDITARKRTEQRLAAQYAVTRVLAGATTLREATPHILQAICEGLTWEVGILWRLDRQASLLRCVEIWQSPPLQAAQSHAINRRQAFPRGMGFPGRVWASAEPAWIVDVTKDPNFPRAPAASREGFRAAMAFPIMLGSEVLGVMEFLSRAERQPEPDLIEMMKAIGSQVGQLIGRRRAEAALRESEKRVRLIVESSLDAVVTMDGRGLVTGWNPQAEAIFGWQRKEAMNRELCALIIPAEYRDAHRRGLERFLETGEGRVLNKRLELTALRRDGDRFPVELTISPLKLGGRYEFSAFVRDITERKRAERALRQSEERLNATMTHAGLGRWECDLVTGRITESEQIGPMFGKPAGWVHPDYESWRRTIHPDDRDRAVADYEAALVDGAGFQTEYRVLWEDGVTVRWLESSATVLRDEAGRAVRVTDLDRNITERKRLETALLEANEHLEQRVAERTAQLAQTAMELERANEALARSNLDLQQFAYSASHDLQSPLRSISGFVQLLQAQYGGSLDAQADEWIGRTVKATKQMQNLIRDLLAYARVDAQARPFQRIPLRDMFDDAVSLLDASAREAGAQITRGELPEVLGDRPQLVQLMQNLVGNALKYHGQEPPRVHVAADRGPEEWVISVRDNGIGIDPQFHQRIFEIFQRLHNPQEYPGTGIGLALCRRVAHRHGGRIWVESEPGRGSIFYFTIPERTVAS